MSKQTPELCKAELWIHSHCETGEPEQVDVLEWRGRVDLLNYLKDQTKLENFDISIPCDNWRKVLVQFDYVDDNEFDVSIRPLSRKRKVTPSKRTVKKASEATVIDSDRGRLLDSANELVSSLNLKQIAPIINSGVGAQAELSAEEKKAYESALSYLARQFDTGHKDMETIVTKKESERTEENRIE